MKTHSVTMLLRALLRATVLACEHQITSLVQSCAKRRMISSLGSRSSLPTNSAGEIHVVQTLTVPHLPRTFSDPQLILALTSQARNVFMRRSRLCCRPATNHLRATRTLCFDPEYADAAYRLARLHIAGIDNPQSSRGSESELVLRLLLAQYLAKHASELGRFEPLAPARFDRTKYSLRLQCQGWYAVDELMPLGGTWAEQISEPELGPFHKFTNVGGSVEITFLSTDRAIAVRRRLRRTKNRHIATRCQILRHTAEDYFPHALRGEDVLHLIVG